MTIRTRSLPLLTVLFLVPAGNDASANDALTIQVLGPHEQAERLFSLFRGSRVPHPAAALAAWRHATGGRSSPGKAFEAALAALNPSMLPELKRLDGTEIVLDQAEGSKSLTWRATIPHDDGSLAAVATALALTEGGSEDPIVNLPVLRLGAPGSAISIVRPGCLAFASTREGLKRANESPVAKIDFGEPRSGVFARLDPSRLRDLTSLPGRRLGEALNASGCHDVRGRLALEDETLSLRVDTNRPLRKGESPVVDPNWLDVVPAERTLAAVSVALDTRRESLDMAFAVFDRVERCDPARAGVAPLRVRLNLMAAAARISPENDVWPALKGLTAAWLVDDEGQTTGVIVAVHTINAESAERLAVEVIPRLLSAISRRPGVNSEIEGKPVEVARRGLNVVIGWGTGSLAAAIEAMENPERSAGTAIRSGWDQQTPRRSGAFWPGRYRRFVKKDSPLALALNQSPPVIWQGSDRDPGARDVVRWSGLRATLHRWLDALPLDPPPDH